MNTRSVEQKDYSAETGGNFLDRQVYTQFKMFSILIYTNI